MIDKTAIYKIAKFDLSTYEDFIKIRTLPHYEVSKNVISFSASYLDHYYEVQQKLPISLQSNQFDYQEVIEKVAFFKERYAIFADAGLGKTYILYQLALLVLAVSKNTVGKVVICVPLNVLSQFMEMSEFFDDFPEYINLHQDKAMSLKEWCYYDNVPRIAFVNHHYFIKEQELRNVEAFLLDECSILKGGIGGDGKIAKHLIQATRDIRYKYAASATPAPNDRIEYGMVAWFLGYVNSLKEFEAQWFVNKNDKMVLRRHSHKRFYAHLASWSIFIRSPKSYGFEDNLKNLKPYKEIHKRVDLTPEQDKAIKQFTVTSDEQFTLPGIAHKPTGIVKRNKFSEISKGFYYKINDNGNRTIIHVNSNKPQMIVDTVMEHRPEQVIIAVYFDEEGKILNNLLLDKNLKSIHITGKTKLEDRAELLNQFRMGKIDILIAQISLIGMGLNLQYCRISIVSGMGDSYEQYYQFIKRTHRYGQDKQVLIYHIYTDYEEVILQNVLGKKKEHEQDFAYQEKLYIDSLYDELKDFLEMENYIPVTAKELEIEPIITDRYELYHGDSKKIMYEVAQGKNYYSLKPNSVDFSVFSKPFMGDMFTYSSDPADMGNTRGGGAVAGGDEFMIDVRFFFEGMKIVTKPGRLMCCHMEDVPLRKGLDGHSGLFDFPGRANIEAVNAGWILVGKITIPKNQQMQSIVKHVSNLTMGSMITDRLRIAPAMNGYLYLYRKPGDADIKIADIFKCRECAFEGYTSELIGYDIIEAKGQLSIKMAHYATCQCPNCNTVNPYIFTEMDGDKWVMYAEGVWPEIGFNKDFAKYANMTKSERWLELIYTTLGIWPDIIESDVLKNPFRGKGKAANELEDSDKHLCPLPLTIARRAIELYTMPGDIVYDPFSGSGTTIVEALKLGRKAIGSELKSEYFMMTARNAEVAIKKNMQMEIEWE